MTDAVAWHDAHAARFAARYRLSRAFGERARVWQRQIERFCPAGGRVLDAGCGPGVMTALAAPLASRLLAFDPSPAMLALAAETSPPNAEFRLGAIGDDALLGAERFDLVLCSSVLEYLDDPWEALRWLSAKLRPGGTLLFSLPNGASLYRRAERLAFRLTGRPRYRAHLRHAPEPTAVLAQVARLGLAPVHTEPFGPAPFVSALGVADTMFLVACRRLA